MCTCIWLPQARYPVLQCQSFVSIAFATILYTHAPPISCIIPFVQPGELRPPAHASGGGGVAVRRPRLPTQAAHARSAARLFLAWSVVQNVHATDKQVLYGDSAVLCKLLVPGCVPCKALPGLSLSAHAIVAHLATLSPTSQAAWRAWPHSSCLGSSCSTTTATPGSGRPRCWVRLVVIRSKGCLLLICRCACAREWQSALLSERRCCSGLGVCSEGRAPFDLPHGHARELRHAPLEGKHARSTLRSTLRHANPLFLLHANTPVVSIVLLPAKHILPDATER